MERLDNIINVGEGSTIERGFGYCSAYNHSYTCHFESDWLYDKCKEQGFDESLKEDGISETDLKYADCQVFIHGDTVSIFVYAKGSMHNAMIKAPIKDAEEHAYVVVSPETKHRSWGPLGD